MKDANVLWDPLICNGSRYTTESIRHFVLDIQRPELELFGHEWAAELPEMLVVLEHKARGLVPDRVPEVLYLKAPEMCMQPMELLGNGPFPMLGHVILASRIGRWIGLGVCSDTRVEQAIKNGKIRRIHLGDEPINKKVEKAARGYVRALGEYAKKSSACGYLADAGLNLRRCAQRDDAMDASTKDEVLHLTGQTEELYRKLKEQHLRELDQHKKELLNAVQHAHSGG